MKVNEVRNYPDQDFRLVNMHHDGKTFSYSQVDGRETFEVYFNRNGKAENGHYTSRAYKLHEGELPPIKHTSALTFLKNEFNKIDWQTQSSYHNLKR